MYFNFRRILSQFLGTSIVRKPKGPRRRHQPARVATETLEVRMLLSGMLVSEALSGTASTTIVGTVYEDANSNGVRDQGENGIPNWQVYLDLDNSGTRNTDAVGTLEPLATTNVDGDFTIDHLKPGTYRLAEVVQDGWVATKPISQDVVVKKDKDNKSGNFFNFSGGDIAGTVWNDLNADGERAVDPVTGAFTEPGLAGWTMFIDRDNSRSITPGDPVTLTDADGHYRFSNLPPGDYKVWEVVPANWDVSPGVFDNKQTVTVVARAETTQDYANFSLVNGSIQGTI
ncbi:MAG: hypothetical protein NT069_06325 [Planctomycetota bacterium]|nr:hypothetical protein [Planctomycetota bacterium]